MFAVNCLPGRKSVCHRSLQCLRQREGLLEGQQFVQFEFPVQWGFEPCCPNGYQLVLCGVGNPIQYSFEVGFECSNRGGLTHLRKDPKEILTVITVKALLDLLHKVMPCMQQVIVPLVLIPRSSISNHHKGSETQSMVRRNLVVIEIFFGFKYPRMGVVAVELGLF